MTDRTGEIERRSEALTREIAERMIESERRLCLAESCTGGGVAEMVTRLPGSSRWFDCAWVTYSNAAKQALLGVDASVFERSGAVSEECVLEMVRGALERSPSGYAIAVSGIAGPDGGTALKPVGTVWLAWAFRPVPGMAYEKAAYRFRFEGDRRRVRARAVRTALAGLLHHLQAQGWPTPEWVAPFESD